MNNLDDATLDFLALAVIVGVICLIAVLAPIFGPGVVIVVGILLIASLSYFGSDV